MYRNFCILIFSLLNFIDLSNAQTNEQLSQKQVEFLTDIYLKQANYKGLIRLSPYLKHSNNSKLIGALGIAEFYTKNYTSAEKHLSRANALDTKNELYQELHFYSLLNRGYYFEAQHQISKMEYRLKKRIQALYPSKFFSSAFLEGGVKQLKQKELGRALNYYSLGMTHELGYSAQLNWASNFLSQQLRTAKIDQTELFANIPIALGKGWVITPSTHAIHSNYTGSIVDFGINNQLLFTQVNLRKRLGNLTLQPSIGVHFNQIKSKTNSFTTQNKQILQMGATLGYKTKLTKQLVYAVYPSYYAIRDYEKDASSRYGIDVANNFYYKKWHIFTSYLKKDAEFYATNEGRFYHNTTNNIDNRFSFSIGRKINKQFNILGTAQIEKQTTARNQTLNYNSYFLTLNYNFQ